MQKKLTAWIKNKIPWLYGILKNARNTNKRLARAKKPAWLYFIMRKTKPLSDTFGFDRGTPIDRYYIENFLSENSKCITGKCLEVKNDAYTLKYGHHVVQSDILDIDRTNSKATIYGDLRSLTDVPDSTYDCIMLTQVLQFIDEYEKAIAECRRILKAGGVLLATVPAMSRVDVRAGEWGDFWRFTQAGAWHIFQKYFKRKSIEIRARGNCLAGIGFWAGQSLEEMPKNKLDLLTFRT